MSNAPPPSRESPAQKPARIARNAVETVLFTLREIPVEFDRLGVADRLTHAIEYLYTAIDSGLDSPAHYEGLATAARVVAEARAMLRSAGDPATVPALARALAILDNASSLVTAAASEVSVLQVERRMRLRREAQDAAPKPRPFRASVGVPALHALARRPLPLRVSVDSVVPLAPSAPPARPPVARPTSLEELAAFAASVERGEFAEAAMKEPEEPPPPAAPPPPELAYEPAIEEGELVRRLARDAIEDIANLSTLRHPNPIESWMDQGPFEQRLLANLDYFASLGGSALPIVPLFHAESEVPDPARAFAVAFALGCVEGSDVVDAAVATLKQSAPEELPGFVEGWSLAPNPAIDAALVDLLGHPKAKLASVALDTLAARGTLPLDSCGWILERGAPEMTLALTRALATNGAGPPAIEVLERILAMAAPDDLFLACLESLLARGRGSARDAARALLAGPPSPRADGAAWLLALSGVAADRELLLRYAAGSAAPRLARGLGRFGHVAVLPLLVSWLRTEDDALVAASADALAQLTGADLVEEAEEPWEIVLPPEAREMEGLPKAVRKVKRPSRDPSLWSAFVARFEAQVDARKKHRGGAPFVPDMIVDELAHRDTPPARRDEATLELRIALGVGLRFRTDDWVARQRVQLAAFHGVATSLAPAPGAWWFAGAPSVERSQPPPPP